MKLQYGEDGWLIGRHMTCEKCNKPATRWMLYRGYCDDHWGKDAQEQFFRDMEEGMKKKGDK